MSTLKYAWNLTLESLVKHLKNWTYTPSLRHLCKGDMVRFWRLGHGFAYESIDLEKREIRLLQVLPLKQHSKQTPLTDPTKLRSDPSISRQDTPVSCILEVVSLNDNPKYFALSYTWGPQIFKTIQITSIDGHCENSFEVTANLEEALRNLRQENNPVYIWADAICINQSDEIEKAEQVGMMRDIYEKSISALVWLGPAADESDAAMDGLHRVGKKALGAGILDLRKKHFINWPRPDLDGRRNAQQKALDDLADQDYLEFPYQALKALSERNYWTRVWIVQEIAVPTEVIFICGYKRLSFPVFAAGLIFLAFKREIILPIVSIADLSHPVTGVALQAMLSTQPSHALSALIGARRKYQNEIEGDGPETLIELLARGCVVAVADYSDRQASDPRDRIYGLLGLSSDAKALGIEADYSKSLVQAYTDAARALIQHGCTDILAWCQQPVDRNLEPRQELEALPSWVPDFSSPIRDPLGEPQKYGLFSASGKRGVSSLSADPSQGPNTDHILALAGTKVDAINRLGCHWAPGLSCDFNYLVTRDFLSDIERFCSESQSLSSAVSLNQESCAEATWKIPCFDQVFSGGVSRRRRTSPTGVKGYHELKERLALYPDMGGELLSPECQAYMIAMGYLHNRKPFISNEGYVGLVPAHSRPGDIICVIFGAIVPFVLRKLQNEQYELIGEAYVFGIMDGEFLEGSPREETFYLR